MVAIALDSRGADAVRPWIELAQPDYPCLIDAQHSATDLYGVSNVPMAMWIDEAGRIVRPAEDIGSAMTGVGGAFSSPAFTEVFQHGRFDRAAGRLNPEGVAAIHEARRPLLEALADWVERGSASKYVLSAERARAEMRLPAPEEAQASVLFRLGLHLFDRGEADEAKPLFQRATELWPDSISILRQWGDVEEPGSMGGERFFRKMTALRARTAAR